jgi:hypothetical protein
MTTRALAVVISLFPVLVSAEGIDDWCTVAEQVGEELPSPRCHTYLSLQAEVAGAAAPCWELISEDLPAEVWLSERDRCEATAHWQVCGRSRCY